VDFATRIRSQLDQGRSTDDIVAALVADGMSEANARRLVTRVLSSPPPLPGPAASTPGDADTGDPEARWSLFSGAFLFSLGCTFLAVVHLAGKSNPKVKLTYLAVLGGALAMYKGWRQLQATHSRFPTQLFLAALLGPAIGTYGLYEWKDRIK
jgi:hypothetical protein